MSDRIVRTTAWSRRGMRMVARLFVLGSIALVSSCALLPGLIGAESEGDRAVEAGGAEAADTAIGPETSEAGSERIDDGDASEDRIASGEAVPEDRIATGEALPQETDSVPRIAEGARLLSEGQQSAVRVPLSRAVPSPSVYQEFWRAITANDASRPSLPDVDFAEETVVVVLMGERPTSGYAVRPSTVARRGGIVEVVLDTTVPAPGEMAAQVLTAPYILFTVPYPNAEVQFSGDDPGAGFEGD